ncbi:MAG: Cytochrome c-type biogenesis protein CcmH [Gammaproteobacteria bacterium]|nr:Cytochrome c-type biogenesis protein CcmH [Gammaproteobacteria bacterium]
MRSLILAFLFVLPTFTSAAIESRSFDDPAQRALYQELITELRCLVCQNQNLADSNAGLAEDLRGQAYEMVTAGAGKDDVIEYMVQRYGDFVLYRPPVKPTTLALWLGPFLLLVIALSVVAVIIKRRSTVSDLSDDERAQARDLLNG